MIKLIDLLKEITEAKQVGNLYHFTPLSNLKKILENRVLFVNEENQVSTTRHANMDITSLYGGNSELKKGLARIMLDGDKISTKYKIRSFSYDNLGKDLNLGEEQIVVNGNKFHFIPYLKRIDIFLNKKDSVNPKILELLEKANIPYKVYQGAPISNTPYNQPKDGNPDSININKIPEKRTYTSDELYFPGMKPAKNAKYYQNDFSLKNNISNNDLFTSPEYPGYYIQTGWEKNKEFYNDFYNLRGEKLNVKIIPIPMYNDPKWRAIWKQEETHNGFIEGMIADSYILIPKNEID
jgi:hypothetical protein